MALNGTAAVLILFDRRPGTVDLFRQWHDGQHMPERMAIPGFNRGRRFRLMDEWRFNLGREFLVLYEAKDMSVLMGNDYLERLNNPTVLSRKVGPLAVRNIRGTCRLLYSAGSASGGVLGLIRFKGAESEESISRDGAIKILEQIKDVPGVVAVHWCETDVTASTMKVEERKNRSIEIPASFVLIEAVNARAAGSALFALVDEGRLRRVGATDVCSEGVYILESDTFAAEKCGLPKF